MIKIVTDSTCDLPSDLVRQHDIRVIPTAITIEGRSYRDGVDISRAEFYQRLPRLRTQPTTSAASVEEFEQTYRELSSAEILSIHLGAGLSGVLNAARSGVEASGVRVTLVDSGQVSMALGWQVIAAAETAAAGGSVQDVLDVIASIQKRVKLFALLDTLEYLRRGGRASAVITAFGNLLQIKPLIEVAKSKVTPIARPRTHAGGMDKIVEVIEKLAPLERLAVIHANNLAAAQALAERVKHCLAPGTTAPLIITDATVVVGTHAGPGAVGAAFVQAAT